MKYILLIFLFLTLQASAQNADAIRRMTAADTSLRKIMRQLPLSGKLGSLTGIAKDTKEQPISGVLVIAYNKKKTKVATTKTNSEGAYRLIIPAGDYTLTFFLEPFVERRTNKIIVTESKDTFIDVAMQ